MSRFCSKYNGLIVTDEKKMFFRGRCKTWDCAYCARENKLAWRKAIRRAIIDNHELAGALWSMFTFTMPSYIHESESPVVDSAKHIIKIWNKFMMQFKRHYERRDKQKAKDSGEKYTPRKLTYIRVLEHHKTGVIHIHLLCNISHSPDELYINPKDEKDIRPRWLKQAVEDGTMQVIQSYGFGYRCNVQALGTDKSLAINYVTKYLTKDASTKFAPVLKKLRLRRIQTSRDIKAPKGLSQETWHAKYRLYEQDFNDGAIWKDLNLKKAITKDDIDEIGIYPPANENDDS